MKILIHWFDSKFNLPTILILFWSMFWLLNGGDKFFNGVSRVSPTVKAVLIEPDSITATSEDLSNLAVYEVHEIEPEGWYGVTRDGKFKNYFRRLGIPPVMAVVCLYVFASFEILLGLAFLAMFLWQVLSPDVNYDGPGYFGSRTIHRLAFKLSIMIFFCFSIGDILFGDRAELWEHGTFIVLCAVTYDMWYRTDRYVVEQYKKKLAGEA